MTSSPMTPTGELDVLIGALTDRTSDDERARLEVELVHARIDAFEELAALPSRRRGDDDDIAVTEPTAFRGRLPELAPEQLDATTVRRHLVTDGCAIVRGLLDRATVTELVEGIDRAMTRRDAYRAAERSDGDDIQAEAIDPWYAPLDRDELGDRLERLRGWTEDSGAVLTADSPRMLDALCTMLDRTGLRAVVEDYLGSRPATSVSKCVLRRVPVTAGSAWHQDGAFLGDDIRALNIWTCLTDCGTDAPGLDIVPRRVELLPTGTEGALFPWSVADDLVGDAAGAAGVHRPSFNAGDVVLFDEKFLHRTAIAETMTRDRYAIESWFFPPSTYPQHHLALVV